MLGKGLQYLKIILVFLILLFLFSCVTVEIYVAQTGSGKINNYIIVSDPDTVTTRAQVTGQKNLAP